MFLGGLRLLKYALVQIPLTTGGISAHEQNQPACPAELFDQDLVNATCYRGESASGRLLSRLGLAQIVGATKNCGGTERVNMPASAVPMEDARSSYSDSSLFLLVLCTPYRDYNSEQYVCGSAR